MSITGSSKAESGGGRRRQDLGTHPYLSRLILVTYTGHTVTQPVIFPIPIFNFQPCWWWLPENQIGGFSARNIHVRIETCVRQDVDEMRVHLTRRARIRR